MYAMPHHISSEFQEHFTRLNYLYREEMRIFNEKQDSVLSLKTCVADTHIHTPHTFHSSCFAHCQNLK
jgi:hypothetical protein